MAGLFIVGSQVNKAFEQVSRIVDEGFAFIIEEASKAVGAGVGDVLAIPDKPGDGFPFCANAFIASDMAGSSGPTRMARINRMYVMADFAGLKSVNWVGNIMDNNGTWLDMDVLLARVESLPATEARLELVNEG